MCYFPFDEGEGMSIKDLSGNNLKGALVTAEKGEASIRPSGLRVYAAVLCDSKAMPMSVCPPTAIP